MKNITTLLLILFSASLFAQRYDPTLATLENGDKYQKGIINFKVKPEYRSACTENAIAIEQLLQEFEILGYKSLKKKFRSSQPPASEFNERGQKMADISLIYELSLPVHIDIVATSKKLAQLEWIAYAEPNYVSFDQYIPNDSQLNSVMPYHFANVNAYEAWDITIGDTNVVIGITETAIYTSHPDFVGNIKYNYDDPVGNGDEDSDTYVDNYAGWDMVDNDNNLYVAGEIHGDAVSGIASATADNNLGYAGLGFKCKFLPVKVANNSQSITHGYQGIEYCVNQGCSVINCSWGNTTFSQVAQDVVTWAAVNNDVVLVASAGNANANNLYYPASYNYVLSVTGVDQNDVFNNGTNPPFTRNDSVDVSAPGINVYTTAYFSGNVLYSPPQGGTSMAAPIVSGIAGLVRAKFPCLSALDVIEKIKSTADPIDGLAQNTPYAGLIGTGRVNAEAAVTGSLCNPVGIVEADRPVSMDIYPNPASEEVNVRMSSSSDWNIQIFDTKGKLIMRTFTTSDRTVISSLATGFYVISVTDNTHSFNRKFSIIK